MPVATASSHSLFFVCQIADAPGNPALVGQDFAVPGGWAPRHPTTFLATLGHHLCQSASYRASRCPALHGGKTQTKLKYKEDCDLILEND